MLDIDVESNIQITTCELLNERHGGSLNPGLVPPTDPLRHHPNPIMMPFSIDNKSGRLVFPSQQQQPHHQPQHGAPQRQPQQPGNQPHRPPQQTQHDDSTTPEKYPCKVENNKRMCMTQSMSCPSFAPVSSFTYEVPLFMQQPPSTTTDPIYGSMPDMSGSVPPMVSGDNIVPHPFQLSMPDMLKHPMDTSPHHAPRCPPPVSAPLPLDKPIKKEPISPGSTGAYVDEPKLIQVHSITSLLKLVAQESAENEQNLHSRSPTSVSSKPDTTLLPDTLAQCQICYCYFLTESEVRGHVSNEHMTTDRRMFCSYCNYTTWYEAELVSHLFSKHRQYPKVRYLKCGICSQKFVDKQILSQHMRHHTDYFASRNYFRSKIKIKRVANSN